MCDRQMPCPNCNTIMGDREETACSLLGDVISTSYRCKGCGALTSVTTIPLPTTASHA